MKYLRFVWARYVVMMMYFALMTSFILPVVLGGKSFSLEWVLFEESGASFSIPLLLDWLSVIFFMVVCIISGSVMIFSVFYMMPETKFNRFLFLVMGFVMSMSFLLFIPSIISLMLGWDGLGVISFLLVVFYEDNSSLSSGMLTFMMNRFGDIFLLAAASVWVGVSWSSYSVLGDALTAIWSVSLLVVLGSMTKSAQMPFSAWLPAAMAAPTPVSALVHSSTLVTAGVYLMIRFYSSMPDVMLDFLFMSGSLTLVMSGMNAIFEVDLKKIVAFSTLSQLSFMTISLSVGAVEVCFFHMIMHALFKALMFMCVGYLMLEFSGAQDFRFYSGCWCSSPYVSCWLVVSVLSLLGMPYMSGYFSKDLVIESYFMESIGLWEVFILATGVFLTSTYSIRFLMHCFSTGSMASVKLENHLSFFCWFPLTILGVSSIFAGYFFVNLLLEIHSPMVLNFYLKMIPLSVSVLGVVLGMMMFSLQGNESLSGDSVSGNFLVEFFSSMMFLPVLSSKKVSRSVLESSMKLSRFFDSGWLEMLLGGKGVMLMGQVISYWVKEGQIVHFSGMVLGGAISCVAFTLTVSKVSIMDGSEWLEYWSVVLGN